MSGFPKHKDKAVQAQLVDMAKRGWRIQVLGNGHYRCLCPCGTHTAGMGGTPSDWRASKNFAAQVKRSGC
jgi:hypothetical protein